MSFRQKVTSVAPWEAKVGYSRATRAGRFIAVSGTAPVAEDGGLFAAGDAYAQTQRCIEIIEQALQECGAVLGDVIRTRMFVTDIERWPEIGRAHAEAFAAIRPATSMVEVSRLIDPGMLVEIEADAMLAD